MGAELGILSGGVLGISSQQFKLWAVKTTGCCHGMWTSWEGWYGPPDSESFGLIEFSESLFIGKFDQKASWERSSGRGKGSKSRSDSSNLLSLGFLGILDLDLKILSRLVGFVFTILFT